MEQVVYVKFSNDRDDRFKIRTVITENENEKIVKKYAQHQNAKEHLENIYKYGRLLKTALQGSRFKINECRKKEDYLEFEYLEGATLEQILNKKIQKKDYDTVYQIVKDFYNELNFVAKEVFVPSEDFIKVFGNVSFTKPLKACSVSDIDLIFGNILVDKDTWTVIDYEWSFDFLIPINYIVYRALLYYGNKNKDFFDMNLVKLLAIDKDEVKQYQYMEENFQRYVRGKHNNLSQYTQNNIYLDELVYQKKNYNDSVSHNNISEERNLQIFFDYGEGFSEKNSVKIPYKINFHVQYRLPNDIHAIRIDPADEAVVVKDFLVKADEKILRYNINQGECVAEFYDVFYSNDPQYNIEFNDFSEGKELYIEGEILSITTPEVVELLKKLKAQVEKENILEYESEILRNQNADFLNQIQEKNILLNENENKFASLEKIVIETKDLLEEKENKFASLEKIVIETKDLLEEKEKVLSNQETEIFSLKTEIDSKNEKNMHLNQQLMEVVNSYNIISTSTCWKMTKPIRVILDYIKIFLLKNTKTELLYKGLKSVKNVGMSSTLKKIKQWKRKKKCNIQYLNNKVRQCNEQKQIDMANVTPLELCKKSVAVHVHLYYIDLLDEFFVYLNNIPFQFDIFVSIKNKSDESMVINKLKKLKNVRKIDVKETINRGRDIAPLYVQFGNKISQYDYFLHIHTKKSLFTGKEQYGWRQYSLDCLLGNEEKIRKIFSVFENEELKIGLFFPETYDDMPIVAHEWLENREIGKSVLTSMNIPFDDGLFNYPVGSFFWAKVDAVRPLFDKHFSYEDFPQEKGQTDGTLAHALERAIAFVIKDRGYHLGISDEENNVLTIDKSLKFYQNYFKSTKETAQIYLMQFDLISFDIFDTLITRRVFSPDDIFRVIEKRSKAKYGINIDFVSVRKRAESLAWNKKGSFCSINDIYEEFKNVCSLSQGIILKLQEMEIETEIELCIPREDMLHIFNYLKGHNKKIILISDMYLTSETIVKMLEKCGYVGYDELWISCEKGARKDDGSLWNMFFNKYGGYNTIHVGDNARSDIQIVGDQGRHTFYIMSPITSFKLSNLWECLRQYMNTSVENAVTLGLLINEKLFNSPFCQGKNGNPSIIDSETVGYVAFAPLFVNFIKWVDDNTKEKSKLLFLSREGYLLKKIYDEYCMILGKPNDRSEYFLASRRAVSVAAIKTEEDIKEILGQYYRGPLSNLLKARLGIDLCDGLEEIRVSMGEDLDKVYDIIKNYLGSIFDRAKLERANYLKYINNICNDLQDIAVIDVGYAGTIQYFLMKLLQQNVDGYYLLTQIETKPERIGGKCYALYPLKDCNNETAKKIFNQQLFIEAALQAPFGQLINFESVSGGVFPKYKDDSAVNEKILALQKGIIDYEKTFLNIVKSFGEEIVLDAKFSTEIFDFILSNQWFPKELSREFTVQDDYCSNGNQFYDTATRKWSVRSQ